MNGVIIRVIWPLPAVAGTMETIPLQDWLCAVSWPDGSADSGLTVSEVFSRMEKPGDINGVVSAVTVILPAELSLLESVQLPARNQRQAMQALPFVVEEQLAQELEDVHLAIGMRRPDGRWPVVVISQPIMAALIALAESYDVLLQAVYTDAQLLQVAEDELTVVMHGDRVLFRTAFTAGVVDQIQAVAFVHRLTQSSSTPLSRVTIRHQESDENQRLMAQQLATEFSAVDDVETSLSILPTDFSLFLKQYFEPSSSAGAINLLQGIYQRREVSTGLVWWQVAAAILAFAWLGQLGLQVSSGWFFERTAAKLELLAEQQYRKLFPDARQVSNPRKRLESRLSGGDAPSSSSFAYMFGGSVQALESLPAKEGLSIEQLRYEGKRGELQLDLKAGSIEQLDQFKQALDKAGLHAKISSANDSEAGVTGRLQISTGA